MLSKNPRKINEYKNYFNLKRMLRILQVIVGRSHKEIVEQGTTEFFQGLRSLWSDIYFHYLWRRLILCEIRLNHFGKRTYVIIFFPKIYFSGRRRKCFWLFNFLNSSSHQLISLTLHICLFSTFSRGNNEEINKLESGFTLILFYIP